MTFSLDEQISAVKREILMRTKLYPRWVFGKKMSQAKADQEIAVMRAVLETLEQAQRERTRHDPLAQALNEGDGVYRP